MTSTRESAVETVRQLLFEEAHLISQEVQDALSHDELHRLNDLSAVLDELAELFSKRRGYRIH